MGIVTKFAQNDKRVEYGLNKPPSWATNQFIGTLNLYRCPNTSNIIIPYQSPPKQKLPKVAKSCQKLPMISKGCQ